MMRHFTHAPTVRLIFNLKTELSVLKYESPSRLVQLILMTQHETRRGRDSYRKG